MDKQDKPTLEDYYDNPSKLALAHTMQSAAGLEHSREKVYEATQARLRREKVMRDEILKDFRECELPQYPVELHLPTIPVREERNGTV